MLVSKKMQPMVGGSSVIRQMFEEGIRLAKEFGKEHVYDFSLGNPNVAAPEAVNETIRDLTVTVPSTYLHGYMPNAGFPETRKAVADSLNARFGTDFTPDGVIMTVGAASGLNAVFKTILDPGDEVIVFRPFFVEYRNYAANYDAVLKVVDTDEDFIPVPEKLKQAITERTKAVLINTPNNPTGVVYSEEVIRSLAGIMKEAESKFGHEILLVSDEPYRELAYDGIQVPFVTKYYHNAVVCYSYSKSLSLPGERIGYVAVPGSLSDYDDFVAACVIATRIMGSVNAPALMQKVIERCVDTDISENIAVYDNNRKLLYGILRDNGFEAIYPQGAFYMWIKCPGEEAEFVRICKKHHILVVPGSSFDGPGYVRAAYCVSSDTIRNSAPAWAEAAKELLTNAR